MPRTIHRTAVLSLHNPTRHARAALDRAFRHYTAAYTECLHACERQYDAPTLLSLASYRRDSHSGKPVMNARTLAKRLFSAEAAPVVTRTYAAAAAPLEGRLRQSLREHVAQTLLSYAMLYQAWSQHGSTRMAKGNGEAPGEEEEAAETTPLRALPAAVEGSAPRFPSRLRQSDLTPTLHTALAQLVQLADNRVRERELIAQLQRTRQAETIAIPFVGVAAAYGCGLYLNRETNRFYARLDVVGSSSHLGRPITARGRYVDLKTGILTVSEGSEDQRALPDAATFGHGCKSILVPLEMGRWHEEAQRWSVMPGASDVAALPVAYLPQRGNDPHQPEAATPVSAQLVRHVDSRHTGGYRYELHVAFSMPMPEPETTLPPRMRPLLAINRGIRHLYTAIVATPDASCALDVQVTSGKELLVLQQAHEHARQARQQRGVASALALEARRIPTRDRRQRRIGDQHCAQAANAIVALARRYGAQVVMEDFSRLSDRRIPPPLRPILRGRQFEKLARFIDERLEVAGLPRARRVSAYAISLDCPRCGARQDAGAVVKSEHPRLFICAGCGETQDRDVSAAANVARRFVWLQQRGVERHAGIASEQRTTWEAFAAAHPMLELRTPADN